MRFTRSRTVLAAVGLALSVSSLAACGNAGQSDSGSVDVKVDKNAASNFDAGTRMKELADSGKITIGVKFDQPGIGFKGATDDMPKGLDPEIGKILAADLGIDAADIKGKEVCSVTGSTSPRAA